MLAVFKMEAIGDNYFAYSHFHRRKNPAYERRVWQMTKPSLEPWVDHITPLGRERMRPIRDYTDATGIGARGVLLWYFLPPGIYEINERISWQKARRYFVESSNGELREINEAEVPQCLRNAD